MTEILQPLEHGAMSLAGGVTPGHSDRVAVIPSRHADVYNLALMPIR